MIAKLKAFFHSLIADLKARLGAHPIPDDLKGKFFHLIAYLGLSLADGKLTIDEKEELRAELKDVEQALAAWSISTGKP